LITSIGHGADLSFMAVSPQVTLVNSHKAGGRLLLLCITSKESQCTQCVLWGKKLRCIVSQ